MKKIGFACTFLMILSLSLFGGGTQEKDTANASEEEVTVEFQIWVTPNLTVEYWEDLASHFEEENPSINVKLVQATTGESTADKFLQTRLAAGDMPDVCHVFTEEIFVEAGAFMPLPIDDDISKLRNLEGMLKGGKLYTYDSITLIHGLIYYNKDIFADAGITELPKTVAEFEKVCATLKQKGYTPIMMAAADWTAGFELSIFSAPIVFYNNTKWYKDRTEGNVTFQDEDWMTALTKFKSYIDKEYIFKGAIGTDYPTAQQLFLDGKGAMYPMGSWFSGSPEAEGADFEIGVFAPTTLYGGSYLAAPANRTGYAVSADTEHPEEAVALAKYMATAVYPVSKRLALEGGFSDFPDSDEYMYDMNSIQEEVYELFKNTEVMTNNYNHPVGAPAPQGFTDALGKAAQNLFTGGTPEESAEILDSFWNDAIEE
jgi:multiple sugar transport system substrate-binding protein/raffinose/stachyose/melibiose transport system substrate-binding protein